MQRVLAAILALSICARAGNALRWSGFGGSPEKQHDKTERPLIGILTQPGSPAPANHTYLAASYVKYVEAAGARAVPIQCDLPRSEIERRFQQVNGVLLPGGGADLRPKHCYFDAAAQLLQLTMAANQHGEHVPLHASCLGFEVLAVIVSRNESVLEFSDALDFAAALTPTRHAKRSRFWSRLPWRVRRNLQHKPYAMENHSWGVSLAGFLGNKPLADFFEVVTMSQDRQGAAYVSTVESKKYPITATQWHPEKNAFEWARRLHIPHHPGAVEVTLAVARQLVEDARRNSHNPGSPQEEDELLIYNWPSVFTGKGGQTGHGESDFDQAHFFPAVTTDQPVLQNDTRHWGASAQGTLHVMLS